MHVTLNGRQYTAGGSLLSFRYLTPGMVFVSSVSPPVGPLAGGTNVTVRGTNFVNLPDSLSCAFGGLSDGAGGTGGTGDMGSTGSVDAAAVVNATFIDSSTLLCISPPVDSEVVVHVRLSLNLQEYYSGADFRYHAPSTALASARPSSKGRSGGGTCSDAATPLPQPSST